MTKFSPKSESERPYCWDELGELVRFLLSEQGCPWDRRQTLDSLQPYLIEECREVLAAQAARDQEALREELGDVLFQIVFQSELAAREQAFTLDEVIDAVTAKMVSRHSHLFEDDQVLSPEEVEKLWVVNKNKEKKKAEDASDEDFGASVKAGAGAVAAALALQKEAARQGFDWDDAEGAMWKVSEELLEVREARQENQERLTEEAGDLLFAALNTLRLLGVEPEYALSLSNAKFVRRYRAMQMSAKSRGQDFPALNFDEKESLWREVKTEPSGYSAAQNSAEDADERKQSE